MWSKILKTFPFKFKYLSIPYAVLIVVLYRGTMLGTATLVKARLYPHGTPRRQPRRLGRVVGLGLVPAGSGTRTGGAGGGTRLGLGRTRAGSRRDETPQPCVEGAAAGGGRLDRARTAGPAACTIFYIFDWVFYCFQIYNCHYYMCQ